MALTVVFLSFKKMTQWLALGHMKHFSITYYVINVPRFFAPI